MLNHLNYRNNRRVITRVLFMGKCALEACAGRKTLIRLRIRAIWSGHSLSAYGMLGILKNELMEGKQSRDTRIRDVRI